MLSEVGRSMREIIIKKKNNNNFGVAFWKVFPVCKGPSPWGQFVICADIHFRGELKEGQTDCGYG